MSARNLLCDGRTGSALPAVGRAIGEPESRAGRGPRSPRAPVPSGVGVSVGRHLLFIRKMLLQLIRLVLIVGLLRAHVEAATDQRIRVYVVDDISIHPLHELVRRQAT